MKSIVLMVSAFFLLHSGAYAQDARLLIDTAKKDTLPYMKFRSLPAFNIMLSDSATIFNTYNIPKGKPVALMLFDPECKHCKDLTRKLTENMDSLKDIQFYMFTAAHSMTAIRKFYEDFHLANYSNIKVIGRDYEFFFHEYYGVKFVPDIALYDSNKKLIKLFEANATVKDLYEYTHQ